jgi:predicted alpha/beta superfamily hydrolase
MAQAVIGVVKLHTVGQIPISGSLWISVMVLRCGVLSAALLIALPSSSPAYAKRPPGSSGKQSALAASPGIISREFTSTRNGIKYKLTILLPEDYAKDSRRYPVMYALDGNWLAPIAKEALGWAGYGHIVVGIDSDDPDFHWQDLPTAGHDRHWDVRADRGAANFLNIVLHEIKPTIDATYRTAPDAGIVGHSLGGFFALYAGFHAPDTFHHVIAFSPSLVWQDDVLQREQSELARIRADMPARFYVDFGGLEQQTDRASRLGEAVLSQGYPSVRWQSKVVANQTHSSVVLADALEAVQAVYAPELRHPDPMELARLSGQYHLANGASLVLFPRDGQLMMKLSEYDNDPIVLLSTEPDKFFVRELGTRIEIKRPGAVGPDIVLFKQPSPGPNGSNVTPRIEGTKIVPGGE